MVDYDYGARTNPSNLTTNDTELSERIDNYTAYGCRTGGWNFATTNSCGALNKSIEMLLNSADKNKAIIFMSGGAPTHKCDELYSNSRLVEEYVNATAQNPDFDGETLITYKEYCQNDLKGHFGVIPYKQEFGNHPGEWYKIIDNTYADEDDFVDVENFGFVCTPSLGYCAFCANDQGVRGRFDVLKYAIMAKEKYNITVVTVGVDIPSMDKVGELGGQGYGFPYPEIILKDMSAGDYYAMMENYNGTNYRATVSPCWKYNNLSPQLCNAYRLCFK